MVKLCIRNIAILSIMGLIASCSSTPQPLPNYPPVRFTNEAPFNLQVANVQIVQQYNAPMKAPNVDHLSPVSPSAAVQTWADDRLKAKGGKYLMKVVIKDASVIEKDLPASTGLKGALTNDQTTLYTGHLQVSLEIYTEDPLFPAAEVSGDVTSTESIAEDASVNDRQALLYALSKELIENLDKEIAKTIPQYFGKYITTP